MLFRQKLDPGSVIRELRSERGWTASELCRRCKLSPAQMSKLERGKGHIRVDTLVRIAKALAIKPAVFIMTERDREIFNKHCGIKW